MGKLHYLGLAGGIAGTALSLAAAPTTAQAQACKGPGAPTTTQTTCITAVQIPGNPIRSYDISWVNPDRREYYLADRSNSGIDIIDTRKLKFKRTIGGFVGIKFNSAGGVNNNISGPDGVTTHGRWVYAGDGDSTLKVIDLDAPNATAIKQTISTGGTTRLDELALNKEGTLLLGANNAEDPPFGTLFRANGDDHSSSVSILRKITIDPKIVPAGFGLSIEQPTWEERTGRFYASVPIIANNPSSAASSDTPCNYGQGSGPITCSGGLLVIDPASPATVIGAYNAKTHTGVVPLKNCGPNGITVGPNSDMLLGCTSANLPSGLTSLIVNARDPVRRQTAVAGITGSDEVWYNSGDERYYTGSNRAVGGAVLGVIDASSKRLIETIPQSSGSHSVAADSMRNRIFVPQNAPVAVVGSGGDTTAVGAGICGSTNGCVAVYGSGAGQDHGRSDDDDRATD